MFARSQPSVKVNFVLLPTPSLTVVLSPSPTRGGKINLAPHPDWLYLALGLGVCRHGTLLLKSQHREQKWPIIPKFHNDVLYWPIGISRMGNSGCFHRGKPQRRSCAIQTNDACWVFQCFYNPPSSDIDYGIFNVHSDVTACDCTRECRVLWESALKVDSGKKKLLAVPGNWTCVSGVPVRRSANWATTPFVTGKAFFFFLLLIFYIFHLCDVGMGGFPGA